MRILLVINKPNREAKIMDSIRRQILLINKDAVVEIKEMCTPEFNKFVFKFKPNVILTFPFTCIGFSKWYYLFKVFLNSKIICFRAEGVVDFSSEYNTMWAVGFDSYGSTLVDYELFWGSKLSEVVGKYLISQGKLNSKEQIKVVGYPRLESYFNPDDDYTFSFPSRIKNKLNTYRKEKIALFITGFQLANYSREDLFNAGDLDAENRLDYLLESVKMAKEYRSKWIKNIIITANQNRDSLIIVKKHPIEGRNDYKEFNNIDNILFIYEDFDIDQIMSYAGILFHYGSTALVDSYLLGIPSIYVYSENSLNWYPDLGWPSSGKVHIDNVSQVVADYFNNKIVFSINSDQKRVLKEIFNINDNVLYKPSEEIAKIILSKDAINKVKIYDKYFAKALSQIVFLFVYFNTVEVMKKNIMGRGAILFIKKIRSHYLNQAKSIIKN